MAEQCIVIVGRKGTSTNVLYHVLADRFQVNVIIEEPPSLLKLLRWRAARAGWGRVLGQLLFHAAVVVPLRLLSSKRRDEITAEAGLSVAPPPSKRLAHTPSVNSKDLLAQLTRMAPALVVINGTRILTQSTLEAIGLPVLNVHAGITPQYRGVHGAYWALVNNDPEHCGVTVHLVDKGVDTGNILLQGLIKPTGRDNFTTYPVLQLAVGSELLAQAVQEVLSGSEKPIDAPGKSQRWFHPTIREYLHNRRALGIR